MFANADKVDRAGRADLGTAKTFLAASYFIEILNHFGPLDGDLLEKQRYAAWRAAEIRKAVREGRPPLPPSGNTAPSGQESSDVGGAAFGAGQGGPEDLPPAYSSTSSSAAALDALPPAYGSTMNTGGSFRAGSGSYPAPPAPTPLQQQATPLQQPWADMLPSVPPPPAESLAPSHTSMSTSAAGSMTPSSATLRTQRFKLGSRLLFMPQGATQPEQGTVGQVLPGEDGSYQYRVALRERIDVVLDDGKCLAPEVAEGDSVVFLGRGGPAPATVVLVNDMSWPPSYLVRLPDGSEVAAPTEHVALVEPWNMLKPSAATQKAPPSAPSAPAYPPVSPSHSAAALPPPQPVHPGHAEHAMHQGAAPPPPQHARPWPELAHAAPQHSAPAASLSAPPALPPGHKPSVQAILEAQKNAKYAVSSLNFEDVPAAVKYLQTALRALTQQ